jgi:uncharacterized protein (UPF0548 family)
VAPDQLRPDGGAPGRPAGGALACGLRRHGDRARAARTATARGAWEIACLLVRHYEFTDPHILRAMYRYDDELLGRDMLLKGRFFGLRFYLGVRVTRVIDETRGCGAGAERVWGWRYQTLQGHLEQGRLNYEVIKNLASVRSRSESVATPGGPPSRTR